MLPETAAPSPGAFQQAFEAAAADGYDGVICLSLSGGVSATFQAAAAAAKAVAGTVDVRAVDTRSMTIGLGLICLDIADLAATGADLETLEARVADLVPRTQVFGVVDTLEHLEKGGRIGGARALLGSLLSIKPVVTLVDGEVAEESKQRTRARSLRYLADKALGVAPAEPDRRRRRRGHRHRRLPRPARPTSGPSTRSSSASSARWSAPTRAPAPSASA